MQKLVCNNLVWINIQNPTKKDIESLESTYHIHPLVSGELSQQTYRPKVESFNEQLFLVLHFPVRKKKEARHTTTQEIDFIIGKHYLITVHYGEIPSINSLYKELNKNELLCNKNFGSNSGFILYHIISHIFTSTLGDLDQFAVEIDMIEESIYKKQKEQRVVESISNLRYELLDYRRALKPQQSVLESLIGRSGLFFGEKMNPYFTDIIGEYYRVLHALENHKETLDALNDTNASLLSTRSNEVMRRLTIMAFITFPLTLLASIFGMNTRWLPFVGSSQTPYIGGSSHDFLIIFGIMVVGMIVMFMYFKSKHWL